MRRALDKCEREHKYVRVHDDTTIAASLCHISNVALPEESKPDRLPGAGKRDVSISTVALWRSRIRVLALDTESNPIYSTAERQSQQDFFRMASMLCKRKHIGALTFAFRQVNTSQSCTTL